MTFLPCWCFLLPAVLCAQVPHDPSKARVMGLNDVPKTPAEREKARVAAEQRRIRLEAQKRALAEKMARAYEDAKTQREAAAAKAPRKTVLVFPTSSKGSPGPVSRAKVVGTISDQELFLILSR